MKTGAKEKKTRIDWKKNCAAAKYWIAVDGARANDIEQRLHSLQGSTLRYLQEVWTFLGKARKRQPSRRAILSLQDRTIRMMRTVRDSDQAKFRVGFGEPTV